MKVWGHAPRKISPLKAGPSCLPLYVETGIPCSIYVDESENKERDDERGRIDYEECREIYRRKKPLIGVSLIEPHIDRDKVRSPCVEHFVCQYISIYLS